MKHIRHTKWISTVENFWTVEKCDTFIRKSEEIGYELAMVNTERGPKRVEGVRNNKRILFSDKALANEIWSDISGFVKQELGNSKAIGLNEMFRFYKYETGQEFKKHRDQSFIRDETESSYFTLMIYLNDGFEGGQTTFKDLVVEPKKGAALIFLHDLEHEGSKLTMGEKYVLRTDIMYRLNGVG